MKTIVRTVNALFLGALLLAGSTSFAQNNSDNKPFLVATYPSSNPLKLWMNIQKNDPKCKIVVRLLDERNRVVFSETMPRSQDKYRQRFDMSAMTDGTYTLQITGGSETVEKSFQVKTSGILERSTQRVLTVVPATEHLTGL
ncbi:hypothetical protein LX87_00127 [Larkinella arboricola]|uniref:Secreted protein (Por secretion system target) n=1 Tax=Larkinella arboricola TaxID=643671 RepID=A0A327X808_LARAB|nr:hypothetical protein [Larkinella arboricola]RAK02013.1 hypothetical protein LX87_00127 [Larkinella arboricola]